MSDDNAADVVGKPGVELRPAGGTRSIGGAGIELHELSQLPGAASTVQISCIDYAADHHQVQTIPADRLADFLERHRPEWSHVRWIDVDGLSDMGVISALASKYSLHPLAIEDLLQTGQRPKAEPYPAQGEFLARLFIQMKMISLEGGAIRSEQISVFVGHNTVLTFQEAPGDVWDCIRERIRKPGSRLRTNDASFLVYSLVDANVDSIFPILEHFGERLEALEDSVMDHPEPHLIRDIHSFKRELQTLKRAVWPMRELIHALQMESHECFSETSRLYLRDVYDHVIQIIDVIESYREMSIALAETYMSMVGQRMNEIMKLLTIIGTIFIPLTFLAGVYGMNFEWMPELKTRWAYPLFWVVCTGMALLMFIFFRRRRWL